jgi:hypothetical protein
MGGIVKMVGVVGVVMGREKEMEGEPVEDKKGGRRDMRAARLIFQRCIVKNSRRPS